MSDSVFDDVMGYRANEEVNSEVVTKLKPTERMLQALEKKGFVLDNTKEIFEVNRNQIIVSCAGSGKTFTLIMKILYDELTGEAIKLSEVNGNTIKVPDSTWVCTYLKTGAEELAKETRGWTQKLNLFDSTSYISFSTIHAEFKRVLDAIGVKTNIISDSENTKYLCEVVKQYSLKDVNGSSLVNYNGTASETLKNLKTALTTTRNRLDDSKYDNDIYDEINIGPVLIDSILKDWKTKRFINLYMDFEDIQEFLYEECIVKESEELIKFLMDRYNFIYIDEFQDTSQIQYAILKVYALGTKKVVVVGDDDQSVYGWRGSDPNIIVHEFIKDFNPTISKLSLNYRCPSNILDAVIPSIELNENRLEKTMQSSKEGGLVRIGEFGSYTRMSKELGKLVEEDVKKGKSVVILCRVNSDGLMPALVLDKIANFNYSIAGEGMTFDSYIGKMVLGIVRLFTESHSNYVKTALNMLTRDKYEVNSLIKECKNNNMSIWQVPNEDIQYSCPGLANRLISWKEIRKEKGDVVALKQVLSYYRTDVFERKSQFNMVVKSMLLTMESLVDYLEVTSASEFLSELLEMNNRLKARMKHRYGTKVRITTVHEYKGKEADSAYIWNDSEDVFPHKKTDLTDVAQLEEERRLHYIAWTRARETITTLYLKDNKGMFVNELDLTGKGVEYVMNDSNVVQTFNGGSVEKQKAFKELEERVIREEDGDSTWGNSANEPIGYWG